MFLLRGYETQTLPQEPACLSPGLLVSGILTNCPNCCINLRIWAYTFKNNAQECFMVPTFLFIAFLVLLFVGFVFSRWIGSLKTPVKHRKLQAKRHKR